MHLQDYHAVYMASTYYILNQITSFNEILYEHYVGGNPNFMLFNFL
jgi:hypothetical protein